MERLRNYDILFSSLKLGVHSFKMSVEQPFFDLFDFKQEFKTPKVEVDVQINKHSSFLELEVKTEGVVILECDISGEEFEQTVKNEIKTLIKFGEIFDDTNEEILILPFGSHSVNVSQLIYECVLLSIPMKHVHPKYSEGYKDEHTDLLEKYGLSDEEGE